MKQQVKPLLGIPTPCFRVSVQVPATLPPFPFLLMRPGRDPDGAGGSWCQPAHMLAATWNLGNEPSDGSLSLFLIIKNEQSQT